MILTDEHLHAMRLLQTGAIPDAETCLRWAEAGVVDTDLVARYEDVLGHEVGTRPAMGAPLTLDLLAKAAVVGLRPFDTTDDGALWHRVGVRIAAATDADTCMEVIAAALDAGVAPEYVNAVLDVLAARADDRLTLDAVDWTKPLGETMDALVNGLSAREVDAYAALGLTGAVAYGAAKQGHTPDRIAAARKIGVAVDLLVTVPHEWLAFVAADTADLFARLAATPWGSSTYNGRRHVADYALFGFRHGPRFTLEEAVAFGERGKDRHYAEAWNEAVNGKGRRRRSRAEGTWGTVLTLHDAGVRPSHANTYKMVGAKTEGQMLQAARLGIDPKRAAHLRNTCGTPTGNWKRDPEMKRTNKIDSFESLLRAHERDLANAATG